MAAFSPVMSNKLYIQIHNQIRDAILNGTFKPGDKLPSEKELCQMFNVSRVPVREALCALELNGMVDSVQGGGVYVREQPSAGHVLSQAIEPQEIIRARMVLEPDIAREAALHLDEENRKKAQELKEILEKKTYEFKVKAKEGKVSGSVSTKQIEEAVKKDGYTIDKRKIIDSEPLNNLGTYDVKIELYKDVIAVLKVILIEE